MKCQLFINSVSAETADDSSRPYARVYLLTLPVSHIWSCELCKLSNIYQSPQTGPKNWTLVRIWTNFWNGPKNGLRSDFLTSLDF